jgi:hypothetical protein
MKPEHPSMTADAVMPGQGRGDRWYLAGLTPQAVGGVVFLATLLTQSGCYKPFLTDSDRRTQFDAYDSVRNNYAKRYTFDEFGNRRPNLKARLLRDD